MTGGSSNSIYHSSTEQLLKGKTSWTITENSLPARMYGLGSISYNNQVFVTDKLFTTKHSYIHAFIQLFILFSGGYDQDARLESDQILLYDEDTTTFKQAGKMEQRRYAHSMSVVDKSNFACS